MQNVSAYAMTGPENFSNNYQVILDNKYTTKFIEFFFSLFICQYIKNKNSWTLIILSVLSVSSFLVFLVAMRLAINAYKFVL